MRSGRRQDGRGAARRGPSVMIGGVLVLVAVVAVIVLYTRRQEGSAEATQMLAQAAAYESHAEVGDPQLLLGKSGSRPPPSPVVKDEVARAEAVDAALDWRRRHPAARPRSTGSCSGRPA